MNLFHFFFSFLSIFPSVVWCVCNSELSVNISKNVERCIEFRLERAREKKKARTRESQITEWCWLEQHHRELSTKLYKKSVSFTYGILLLLLLLLLFRQFKKKKFFFHNRLSCYVIGWFSLMKVKQKDTVMFRFIRKYWLIRE